MTAAQRYKKLIQSFVSKKDLQLVENPVQLRGIEQCYYINPMFPEIIQTVRIKGMHLTAKHWIMNMIKLGNRVYIKKDGKEIK